MLKADWSLARQSYFHQVYSNAIFAHSPFGRNLLILGSTKVSVAHNTLVLRYLLPFHNTQDWHNGNSPWNTSSS